MLTNCEIKGLTAKDIIMSLSESFKTEFDKENNEYCFDIPDKIGSGYIKTVEFSHGISVLVLDIRLKNNLFFVFEKASTNLLHLLFNTSSSIKHAGNDDEKSKINKLQRVIFSNGVSEKHTFELIKEQHSCIFAININRKTFEDKLISISDDFTEELSSELATIFRDLNGVNYVYNQDYFSLEVSKIIEEFKTCELEELLKPIFLEAKTYEILTSQFQDYKDNLKGKKKDKLLRKSTVEKIEKAVEIIENELDISINVHKLAKRVGLNQNTLQSGFKTLFKKSVNEYIKNYRLHIAKNLLENSELNITEITYKIGINSRSYFSKLFKERYGISPKEYLARIRKTKSA